VALFFYFVLQCTQIPGVHFIRRSIRLLSSADEQLYDYMSTREIENYEQEIDFIPSPPEAIYDLTTSDKAELLKAAGPIERGENP
jgi:hypothetical protein